jgi:hypothetical protein
MSRIDTFLRRLDSVLELPEYDGTPTFIENIQDALDAAMPGEEGFLQQILDLSVRTSPLYVDRAAERAHVLRSACSHLYSILESESLTPSVVMHMDCLSVVAVALEGRQEKEWDDSEQLRLSSSNTIDELKRDGLTMEEILGDETYERELRTLRKFSADKRESHSVWKLMARVVHTYMAAARAFAHHLHLKDVLGHDLKEDKTARLLASRFGITSWDTLREDLRKFMWECETVTYLDLSDGARCAALATLTLSHPASPVSNSVMCTATAAIVLGVRPPSIPKSSITSAMRLAFAIAFLLFFMATRAGSHAKSTVMMHGTISPALATLMSLHAPIDRPDAFSMPFTSRYTSPCLSPTTDATSFVTLG